MIQSRILNAVVLAIGTAFLAVAGLAVLDLARSREFALGAAVVVLPVAIGVWCVHGALSNLRAKRRAGSDGSEAPPLYQKVAGILAAGGAIGIVGVAIELWLFAPLPPNSKLWWLHVPLLTLFGLGILGPLLVFPLAALFGRRKSNP